MPYHPFVRLNVTAPYMAGLLAMRCIRAQPPKHTPPYNDREVTLAKATDSTRINLIRNLGGDHVRTRHDTRSLPDGPLHSFTPASLPPPQTPPSTL